MYPYDWFCGPGSHINALFCIPNTQYLNLTTTLLTINKQQIRNLLREES